MWRFLALTGITVLSTACKRVPPAEAPTDPSKAAISAERCGESEIDCLNLRWWNRFLEEDRRLPKLPVETIFGDWVVVAALQDDSHRAGDLWVRIFARRDAWLGGKVSLTREAIVMDAPPGVPIARVGSLPGSAFYPQCTKPDFEAEVRYSASPIEDYVDVWQHFGLEKPVVGRPMFVQCNGTLEFPDDEGGHVAELTVEEAYGMEFLYLYDKDHLILPWGDLEFLLERVRAPSR